MVIPSSSAPEKNSIIDMSMQSRKFLSKEEDKTGTTPKSFVITADTNCGIVSKTGISYSPRSSNANSILNPSIT